MSSKYDEIGENSYFQRSQQILNDLQRQHQHQPMFHFNYGEPHLSMKKHRQATPQEPPTNCSEMLCSINLQAMDLRLVGHLHRFSLLRQDEIRHFTSSHLSQIPHLQYIGN